MKKEFSKDSLRVGNGNRKLKNIFIFLFGSVIILLTFFYLFADIRKVLINTPDDAAYYYKIVENFIAGMGFSFDGLHQTNGFQPLWAYVLIPFDLLSRSDHVLKFRVYLVLQELLLCAAGLINYRSIKKLFCELTAIASSLIFFLFVYMQALNGMESALLILLFTVTIYYGVQFNIVEEKRDIINFIFGILLGLTSLTRLDMLFLDISLGISGIFLLVTEKEQIKRIRKYLIILAGFLIIIMPYLLSNYISTGRFVPISGILKSSFPVISINTEYDFTYSQKFTIIASVLTSLFYLIWFFIRMIKGLDWNNKKNIFRFSLSVISAAIIMHFLFSIFFMKWGVSGWQFIYFGMYLALVVSEPAALAAKRLPVKWTAAGLYFFIIVTVLILSSKILSRYNTNVKESWHAAAYEAALWANSNTKQSDIFAMRDAGIFGFFSNRKVINLDGLVNDLQYQEYLKDRKLNLYLSKNKVRYYVQPVFPENSGVTEGIYNNYKIGFPSYEYSAESDSIILFKENEIYRSAPYIDKSTKTAFVIWKLN